MSTTAGEQPNVAYTWPVKLGSWHHVAYTYDYTYSLQTLYVDGKRVGSQSAIGPIAYDSHPFQIGADIEIGVEDFFMDGSLDEVSLYNRALSTAEIQAIYNAGSEGKYSVTSLMPNFVVSLDGYSTNTIILPNFAGGWQSFTNSFVASNDQVTVEFAGNTLSTLFDDIELVELPDDNYKNDYLPEEPLTPFFGENAQGCWTLEVWDTRDDSALTNNGTLLSWNLQMTISSTNVHLIVLTNHVPYNNGPAAGNSITYFAVDVPEVANYATNILASGAGPLNLLFNQTALPTGQLQGDVTLLFDTTLGYDTLSTGGSPPPLIPGKRYFLGVQNPSSTPAKFTVEVGFDQGPLPAPAFVGASVPTPASGLSLVWSAVGGQSYTVEASTDLINWSVVTNIVAQSSTVTYTDTVPVNTQAERFFRLWMQ
jgi:hypothetical protein